MLKVFVAVVTFVVAAVVPVVFHEHKYPVRDGSPVRELRTGDSVSISAGALTSVSRVAPLRVDALPAPVLSGGMPLGTRPLDALGKSLAGTAMAPTQFAARFGEDETCKILGETTLSSAQLQLYEQAIKWQYRQHFFAESMPSAAAINNEEKRSQTTVYASGIPLGRAAVDLDAWPTNTPNRTLSGRGTILYNHFKLLFVYHDALRDADFPASASDHASSGHEQDHSNDFETADSFGNDDAEITALPGEGHSTTVNTGDAVDTDVSTGSIAGGIDDLGIEEVHDEHDIVSQNSGGVDEPAPKNTGDNGDTTEGEDSKISSARAGGRRLLSEDAVSTAPPKSKSSASLDSSARSGAGQEHPAVLTGFLVEPLSIAHQYSAQDRGGGLEACAGQFRSLHSLDSKRMPLLIDASNRQKQLDTDQEKPDTLKVIWTYDVEWHRMDIKPRDRWTTYLTMGGRYDFGVHADAIFTSAGFILVFGVLAAGLAWNKARNLADAQHQSEHDACPPKAQTGANFCVAMGWGAQLFVTAAPLLLLRSAGQLSYAMDGMFVEAALLIFATLGASAGAYQCSRTQRLLGVRVAALNAMPSTVEQKLLSLAQRFVAVLLWWQSNSSATDEEDIDTSNAKALRSSVSAYWHMCFKPCVLRFALVPAVMFLSFAMLPHSLLLTGKLVPLPLPYMALLEVSQLWLMVLLPSAFLGGYAGFVRQIPNLTRLHHDMRHGERPVSSWLRFLFYFFAGVIPYVAMFAEHHFVLGSLWLNDYFDTEPFLWLALCSSLVLAAMITTTNVLIFDVAHDSCSHQNAFLVSCTSSVYALSYSAYFAWYSPAGLSGTVNGADHSGLHGWYANTVYWAWSLVLCAGFGIMCGWASFHASWHTWSWVTKVHEATATADTPIGDETLLAMADGGTEATDVMYTGSTTRVPGAITAMWSNYFWIKFVAVLTPCVIIMYLTLRCVMLAHHVAHSVARPHLHALNG